MKAIGISEFVEQMDSKAFTIKEILKIRDDLGIPFKKHPLGFFVCTLLQEGPYKIRLHYWMSSINLEVQSLDLMIHDHTFNFKSWVVSGSIENTVYEQASDGLEYNLYSTFYDQNTSILRRENRKFLVAETSVKIISRNNTYEMSAGVLHKTRALENLTFTVLYTEETNVKNPMVLADEKLTATEISFERSEVNEKDMQNYLEHLKIANHLRPTATIP